MKQTRKLILLEIDHLLETFTEQYLSSRENEQAIPLIELDLMKQSIRNLYQQLSDLGQIQESKMFKDALSNQNVTENVIEKQIDPLSVLKKSVEIKNENSISNLEFENYPEAAISIPPDHSIAFAELVNEKEPALPITREVKTTIQSITTSLETNSDPIPPTKLEIIPEKTTSSENIHSEKAPQKQEQQSEKKTNQGTVSATLFDEPHLSVKDKFKEQDSLYKQITKTRQDESLADKLQKQPLMDLKKSIGINERFAFINELFSGNQQLFTESIERLNSFHAYEDARRTLYEDFAGKMKWNTTSKVFSELDELVKRRFSS